MTPGRSMQIDRAWISISAPAAEAAYSSSMIVGSTSAFSFRRIRAVFPSAAAAATSRMCSTSRARIVNGATSSFRKRCGRPKPVT